MTGITTSVPPTSTYTTGASPSVQAKPTPSITSVGTGTSLTENTVGVEQHVDKQHEARIQALSKQVQAGQYLVKPQEVAEEWLKTVR